MASNTTQQLDATREAQGRQGRTLLVVSAAHLISHFHLMVLPVLLPFFKERLGVGYFELALALTTFSAVTGLTQAPMGIVVDRLGARNVLICGLTLAGCAFLALGLLIASAWSYAWLLGAAVLAGLANCVYHPADYTLLNDTIGDDRLGRAFSVHIFAGFLGGAIAPPVLLALAACGGLELALIVAGFAALITALAVLLMPPVAAARRARHGVAAPARSASLVLSPAVLSLTLFFTLLALANNAMCSFSAVALIADGMSFIGANAALTAYLAGSAAGVLAGGALADKTDRHGSIAALGFGLGAVILMAIATRSLTAAALIPAMGLAGFLFGIIQPSRDMLVRKAAPAGAVGRVFAIVSTGFNIGGIVGPMLFGWLIDRGAPRSIFAVAAMFMAITALVGLIAERRRGSPAGDARRASPSAAGGGGGATGES